MSYNWKKLQNGSDIRGVAIDGVKDEPINLNPEIIEVLGKAFVLWLKQAGYSNISIAVGMDSRISGPKLIEGFANGIISQGANVINCALASTPAMFMTTISENISVQGGVMLTASHLPFNRNGLKFFTNKGGLDKKEISEILTIAAESIFPDVSEKGKVQHYDFISDYSNILVNLIRVKVNHTSNYNEPLKGAKIIVDAGNGAGGFFAEKVLVPLGVDISGSQFLEPDGNFPNHVPNPEDPDAMNSICKAVVANKADLGIIFDTDVDRSAIVDKNGKPINRNALIALIASVILEEQPGSTIVTDSITSEGLAHFITNNLSGKHHRFKRGYKNVINEAIRLNSVGEPSWLAIETSGHAALKENYFLDDGAYLVAKLLIKMAQLNTENKELGQLIDELPFPFDSKEFRLSITTNDFIDYGNMVIEKLLEQVESVDGWKKESVNFEGIRVKCNNENEQGWFLLRMSLHDPVMPLNIESNVKGGIEIIKSKFKEQIKGFELLNSKAL